MLQFGWLSPVAGHAGSGFQPIVMYQEQHILPQVLPHFDSVWIADHFYGFDSDRTEGFLEGWTTLTWLAARFPDVHAVPPRARPWVSQPGPHRQDGVDAASALRRAIHARHRGGWRESEYRSYGYDFPTTAVRLRQLEEVVQICRLMWTEEHPTFTGTYFQIDDAAATPRPEVVPPICIGSAGEQVGLPIVGRQADMWNIFFPGDEDWKRKRGIVDAAAECGGSRSWCDRELRDHCRRSPRLRRVVRAMARSAHAPDAAGDHPLRVRLRTPARTRAGAALRGTGDPADEIELTPIQRTVNAMRTARSGADGRC